MAKAKTTFFCTQCGGESVRWMGKCPHCGAWNSLVEERISAAVPVGPGRVQLPSAPARPISQVQATASQRLLTSIPELDIVLGGGLVPASSILLGGEPGIGKSTLLLQAAKEMCRYGRVLYITGEESAEQVRLRADRLGCLDDQLYLLAQTDMEAALSSAAALKPALVVVDSVQALYTPGLEAAPGSVSQVRSVAAAAIGLARESGATMLLIGHVTKEGQLAGPRVLEHMVDTVLYFEGEQHNAFRLLRAVKNRFGATSEVGVFEMSAAGLTSLSSPSAYFLAQRHGGAAGSAVACVIQGNRPLLVEIQALVSPSGLTNPRRVAAGFDYNRLQMIIAVLHRKLGMNLANKDVYVNVAGGLRVDDPGADLAVAAAIVSSLLDKGVEEQILLQGEVGLLGELRSVSALERRGREGAAFGFTAMICPADKETGTAIRRLTAADLATALTYLGFSRNSYQKEGEE